MKIYQILAIIIVANLLQVNVIYANKGTVNYSDRAEYSVKIFYIESLHKNKIIKNLPEADVLCSINSFNFYRFCKSENPFNSSYIISLSWKIVDLNISKINLLIYR